MGFEAWVASYLGRPVRVGDLMDLAIVDTNDAHALPTALDEWRYQRITTSAMALAGAGSAVAVATLVPLIQVDPDMSIEWGWMVASCVASTILNLSRVLAFSFV